LIDGFLSTVNYLYNIEESDPYFANLNLIEALHINSNENRWILIKKYLADSQKLSQEIGGYRSDDISQWNSIVDNQIAVLSQLEEGTGADALLDTIKSEYEEFQLLTRKSIPQEALRDSYWEYMTDKAKKVLLDLIDFERKYEMGHPYINEMRKEIFHYLDESRNGWNEIYDQAQRHMRTVEDAYMEIKSSFEGGDLDNTVLELVKLDSKHGKKKLEKIHKSLNYRIQQTQEYLEWIDNNQNSIFSRDNPENIYKLFGYISETLDGKYVIPRVYFDKNIESEVSKLYKELQILLTENFKELRNSDEFHIDKVTQLTKLSIRCRKILKIMSEEKNEEK
jgi:hypothetical protein